MILDVLAQDAHFITRSLFAIILGGLIGFEREYKNKPAGLKTHALLALGASAFTYLSVALSTGGDPGRIAAQIVSGIGFIGGGAIMHSKKVVHGITTASTLWVVSAIGMLVGAGYIVPGMIVTFFVLATLIYIKPLTKIHNDKQEYAVTIELDNIGYLDILEDMINKFELQIERKELIRNHQTLQLDLAYGTSPITQHLFLKRLYLMGGLGKITKI
ncbi:MAG: MgtC/SapB family protein [Candidatus Margulisiibacteriota bacterium]